MFVAPRRGADRARMPVGVQQPVGIQSDIRVVGVQFLSDGGGLELEAKTPANGLYRAIKGRLRIEAGFGRGVSRDGPFASTT